MLEMSRFSCAVVLCCFVLLAVATVTTSAEQEWIQPTFIEEELAAPPRVWQKSASEHLGPVSSHSSEEEPRSLVSTESQATVSAEAKAAAHAKAVLAATVTAEGKSHAQLMAEIEARSPALWQAFKAKFKKTYSDEASRYAIFTRNLVQIAQLNARVAAHSKLPMHLRAVFSHDHGLADLSDEEFKGLRGLTPSTGTPNLPLAPKAPRRVLASPKAATTPTTTSQKSKTKTKAIKHKKVFLELETEVEAEADSSEPLDCDWRYWSSPIRNQGNRCKSCWAHSAVATLETAFAIKTGLRLVLSPQQILDCTRNNAANGCNGGEPLAALYWLAANGGAATEYKYPYQETQHSKCTLTKDARNPSLDFNAPNPPDPIPVPVNVSMAIPWTTQFSIQPPDENELGHQLSSGGVISVNIDSSQLNHHNLGVLDSSIGCSSNVRAIDHAVNIEGLGTDRATGHRFWILRNSWGVGWGENGRFRLLYGANTCSVASQPVRADAIQLATN